MFLAKLTEFISNTCDFWWRVYAVLRLFFSRRPTTVFWCVVSVIVISFYCVLPAWALAHIGDETSKDQPPIAYVYPSSAISMEVSSFRIGNSLFHREPRAVSFATFSMVVWRMSVLGHYFKLKTTARSLFSAGEIVSSNSAMFAAIAFTEPRTPRRVLEVTVILDDKQSVKFYPYEIHCFHAVSVPQGIWGYLS